MTPRGTMPQASASEWCGVGSAPANRYTPIDTRSSASRFHSFHTVDASTPEARASAVRKMPPERARSFRRWSGGVFTARA